MTSVLTLNGKALVASGSVLTGDIGGGGGDTDIDLTPGVDFIDYDGSTVERWVTADVAGKSALPDNPTHTGLTAQGWNWTLADIKTYMTNHPEAVMTIGQMYTTASGDTEIDCTFPADSLSPYLLICPNGTVEVDWGDGSAKDSVTGTSYTTNVPTQHTYASAGDYTIKVHVVSGGVGFYVGTSNNVGLLSYKNATTTSWEYSSCVTAIRLGGNVRINNYCFRSLINLKYIILPNNNTYSSTNTFLQNCYCLRSLTLPNNLTSTGGSMAMGCYGLEKLSMPNGITTTGGSSFSGCHNLHYLAMPDTITTINNLTFYACYNLQSLALPNSITSIGSSDFNGCYRLQAINIPSSATTVNASAFQYCYSLPSLTIPSAISTIDGGAFQAAYSLRELHFKPASPPTLSSSTVFSSLNTDCIIYVPTGTLADYTSATNYPSSGTYTYVEE